ncbi:uncharacterized protein B0T15DRAFT_509660 [Chaetomium strumarium]|uniref:Uncharacterized protein n=1 Tax=Chaetomium strumarium TaxID=1170767 RepID=A0AAJ0GZY8_9PEZI|nr:hypothetical protein B0T15DRAFT_509660 [Chaetomium strumarium]
MFLSLPAELRIKVYRLVLCYPDAIGEWSKTLGTAWLENPSRLGSQLLRICKQIHADALPILYGENTFELEISNTWGPYYYGIDYPPALSGIWGERFGRAALPHLRRLSIRVRYTEDHKLSLIREAVREIVTNLQRSPLSSCIEFLRLDCELDCNNENDEINWRHPCWNDYEVEGDRKQCIGVLRLWLGCLRNVEELVIDGLPEKDADVLRDRCQNRSKETPALVDMYAALEQHVGATYKEDLAKALLAAEADDIEKLKATTADILEKMRARWEAVKNDEKLWQFVGRDPA